ncbi:phosphoglucosamine mutase [Halalkalicoccus jeotgali]|uniref:Phosphoglucosamine mutase n=1 Tax=Halalkalicoccus jeotgali (strain DSM 18796 / CECT 7217 / JCM 14584 / KCTC 4019 / B3) TaxID=795797 RepID=D8J5T0_HALJB|nr:phosphoglucosamine mutase [Halalkalicoccus jeotgali]ADJ13736.1 Phosphoglucosamine mutase [Halalkalicoccus jeotgali B3]ELY34218.1 phosphoglucosamine mutase [Halalkalicoccus jeotgali B3]
MNLFGTSGIRGPVGDVVTGDLALSVGRAVATEGAERIVIGRDPRASGEWLLDGTTAGARECGADVLDAGMVATPTLARAVSREGADAGIVITASHNPPEDNGLKLWNPSGQAFDAGQAERIESRIESGEYDLSGWDDGGGRTTVEDATERHAADLVASVGGADSLEGLSAVVDLGNGAGGVTVTALERLGCDVEAMNADPDGSFPNRPSEPTAENCEALCARVGETDADLGIAHDGDADRMMAVDERGRFVPKDVLLALFAREAAREGTRVAVPVDTSLVVEDEVGKIGASVTHTRVGDVHVAERATEPDVVFGGEPSGAWIWPDETLCPDGPLAACKLAATARETPLSELVDGVVSPHLRRDNIETDRKGAVMERVAAAVPEAYPDADLLTIDGVRAGFSDGWFLLRASGTQPLIRVTAESRREERAEELREIALELVEEARRSV